MDRLHPPFSATLGRCAGRFAIAILAAAYAPPVLAHDFWVQPSTYWIPSGSAAPITLQVGHGPSRQRSPIPLRRIVRFETIGPNGVVTDQRGRLHPGEPLRDGEVALQKPGAYVVVLQTDNLAQTHLPALRFNDYLAAEGLTPALRERFRRGQTDRDGSENYRRCAKAILQAGPAATGPQVQVTRPVGLPLEIVPRINPYAEPRAPRLPVQVLYQGRPLADALVKLTRLEDDAMPLQTHLTDKFGRTSFAMPSSGSWLLNVIWTQVQPSTAETDFDTTFSSLSFGFPPRR